MPETEKELRERIKKLEELLRWYVENDDTNEGGRWEEENAYWLRGKRAAQKLLGIPEEE
jgi:hypothetical protein